MNESMGWSFDVEAQFSTVAASQAERRFGASFLMLLHYEEAEEIMLFWEGRSPYLAAVYHYERFLDLVATRITIFSAIVIQKFWKRVKDNPN
jgi:hypothetical protein